ncbi:MAG: TetR/AcrR family transcriptional regulator [Gammaproteobacteria bacterium]|nr:TetR/AcrR family transcriptional regulator [Gammaproteobacteria bacterium]
MARFGVDGSTLERVAKEAGLPRSLLRHNVGNRDELLQALLDRFFAKSNRLTADLLGALPETDRANQLVYYLFDGSSSDTQFAQVSQALVAAAPNHDNLQARVRTWVLNFVGSIAEEIQQSFPKANSQEVYEVASGIVGIYFNAESFAPLARMKKLRSASRNAAIRLLSTLSK